MVNLIVREYDPGRTIRRYDYFRKQNGAKYGLVLYVG